MEANLSNLLSSRYAPTRSHETNTPNFSSEDSSHHSKQTLGNDTVSISRQAQLAYSQSLSRESSIEITTRDGDKVSINLSSHSSSQTNINYSDFRSQNTSSSSLSLSAASQASSQFQISIEGNLDSDEREAIEDLVNDISKVANELFDGNLQSAFKAAASIDYDTDELQAYSFDIKQSRNQQYAAAYIEVAQYQSNSPLSGNISSDSFDLLDKLQELASKALENLNNVIAPDQINSLIKEAYDFLNTIIHDSDEIDLNTDLTDIHEAETKEDDD